MIRGSPKTEPVTAPIRSVVGIDPEDFFSMK
jgi:hypothetical protein